VSLTCRVVTPDKSYFDGEATKVVVPAWNGEMGFLSGHAPLIARLGHGVMRISVPGGGVTRVAIYGGFVKVRDDEVVLLAGGAEAEADIDRADAEAKVGEAQAGLATAGGSEVELRAATETLARAQARLAAVSHASMPIYEL